MGIALFLRQFGKIITMVNVYGPNAHIINYWDSIFRASFINTKNLIIGGDLNFSIGEVESSRALPHKDNLSNYFVRRLDDYSVYDIPPVKLCPTWRNMRSCQFSGQKDRPIYFQ